MQLSPCLQGANSTTQKSTFGSGQMKKISSGAPDNPMGRTRDTRVWNQNSSPEGASGVTLLGSNALSISHTTLVMAADREVACPDLMVFSSR
jgi:hypothetical protein